MFKARFNIHSKIVHPTALFIAATSAANSLDAADATHLQRSFD